VAENLVIVESPAKAKTIERYLGDRFQVLASYGHIRDLPKSDFAVEVEDGGGCRLRYEIPSGSAKHVSALRNAAREAETVWLAPDLDREGEAIAWHVAEVLDLDLDRTNRVTFDEITKEAILAAFEQPRRLNTALVDAQQARRAVDRIVGYRLSPVLWRTVASGISAGRVQSVALRLIVDREDEIRAFVPQEYWDFAGAFAREQDREPTIDAKLHAVGDRRLATPKDLDKQEADPDALARLLLVDSEETAAELRTRAEALAYRVAEVRRSETKRNPKPPFTTSTLQQDAANKLGFSARQTMAVAQQLYEGVRLGSGEQTGLITYMRTDSVNLSETALRDIHALVAEHYGARYTIDAPRTYRSKAKGAQEAHEAIRPTAVARTPQAVRQYLKPDQFKLYDLVWKRTVATQMASAVFDRVSADVVGTEVAGGAERSELAQRADDDGTDLMFRVTGQVLKFDGYLKVYREWRDEDEAGDEESDRLPELDEGQVLDLRQLSAEQHFTNPPPRYTEATLVRTLEAEGIGRPSTYASIIGTIAARDYVRIESRRFFPTALGEVVVSFMKAHFSEVVDVNFTARMESTLDDIAQGGEAWCSTVGRFLDEVDHWVKERKPERPRLPLLHPADCPVCGAPMERVFSGKSKQWFASCSRWPDCEGTLPLNEDGTVGEPEPEPEPDPNVRCPECGKAMLLREGRFGKFFGCPDYPSCKGIRNLSQRAVHLDGDDWRPFVSPTDGTSFMELRTSRYGKTFLGSAGYPDDQFAIWSVPMADPCPECGAPLRPPPKNRKVPTAICAHPELEHHFELDGFDQPSVRTIDVVPGVEAYDPEVGGEPLAGWPEPYEPIAMTFLEARKPAPKKKATGKGAAKKAGTKKSTKKSTRKSPRKAAG
jgi:DNA topoisomerase-1